MARVRGARTAATVAAETFQVERIDVGEARRRADVGGAVGAGGEGDRAGHELVALGEPGGEGGAVQSRRA